MTTIDQNKIKEGFSRYLSGGEQLTSIGVFKKVPTTGSLMLTRGMTWFWARRFFVGVTDRRLIILPDRVNRMQARMSEDVIVADFDEVAFQVDAFNNSILSIQKSQQEKPLNLRFKPGVQVDGIDQFDFIAAVKQGQNSISARS